MSIEKPEKCIYVSPELSENSAIPDTALRIYSIINRFCASGNGADISASRIAKRMGRPRKVVTSHVRWLIDHKMIGRMMQPGKAGGRVTILWTEPPEKWEIEPIDERVKSTLSTDTERVKSAPSGESNQPHRVSQISPIAIKEASPLKLSLKSKSGKAASGVSIWSLSNDDIFPDDWKNNDDFIEAWMDWVEQRRKKKFALTARARKIQATNILDRSGGQILSAIEMLDRASNKGWGECFALDSSDSKGNGSDHNPLIQ